jgi:predicted DNA-binding protein
MNQTISLPKNYTEKLKDEKKATGQTISEIIRRALDFYFERKERGNV